MTYDNAAYLKERYRTLRAAGLCVNCKADAGKFAYCRDCREDMAERDRQRNQKAA